MKNSSEITAGSFYYHYKHDAKGEINNFAYEIIGTAMHTETENFFVIYKPLYPNEQKLFARPIELFTDVVIVEDKEIPHFTLITDIEVIESLQRFSEAKSETMQISS